MNKIASRFSPIGPLLDAIVFALFFTFLRSGGYTGYLTPSTSSTLDFNILLDCFLEGVVLFFIMQYFFCIVGLMPAGGLCLKAYRESRRTKPKSKDKQGPDAEEHKDEERQKGEPHKGNCDGGGNA